MPKVWLFFFFVSHIGMDLFLQFQYKLPSVQTIFAVFIVSAVVKLLPSFKAFLPAVQNDELTVTLLSTETFFFTPAHVPLHRSHKWLQAPTS